MGCLFCVSGVSVTVNGMLLVVKCQLSSVFIAGAGCRWLLLSWVFGCRVLAVYCRCRLSLTFSIFGAQLWIYEPFSYLYRRWTWEWVWCWRVVGRCLPLQSRKSRACFLQTSTLCLLFPVINCNRYTFLLLGKQFSQEVPSVYFWNCYE